MKKRLLFIGVSLFLFVGCTPTKETSYVKIPKEKELYLNHCANCHGGNLQGGFGPSLNQVHQKYTKDQIIKIIRDGKDKMPAQDFISKEDQEVLATWLSKKG